MNDAGAHAPSRLLRSPAGKGSLVRKLADVRLPERFRDLEVLARGGMGVVYRAHDAVLGRDVAIKVLAREHAADAEVTTRFMREARVSARLSGVPNVVTVYDVGGLDDQPFIVMAYLSGGSIQQRLAVEGPQPLGRTLAWLAQAARALDAAHDLGVVHRDVKPANLLLDGDDVVHVADFGLASAVGLRSLTGAGTVMGTAGYLAPEQALGRTAGAASDRYALGVVAFELMTGSRPFAAETWTAEAAAHVHAPVPSARERRDELPRELDAVFQQALAKDPSDRFESCAAFGSALRRTLDESSGTTIRLEPAAWPRTKPGQASAMPVAFARRRRPQWPWLLLPAAAAGIGATLLLNRGAPAPTTAGRPGGQISSARTAAGTTAPAATAPGTSGAALNNEGYALMQRGDYGRALPLLERARTLLRGSRTLDEAYTDYNLAYTRLHLGRCSGVVALLHESQALQHYRPEITAALAEARRRC